MTIHKKIKHGHFKAVILVFALLGLIGIALQLLEYFWPLSGK